ncbi:hypothetical protein UFOVP38_42 [uncultured Caudovirales phage]|uniref:Uncharacterized protein n=1 Tax=uncultured Caudovirales phage TaxID=2100421 RepID=A0A6J5T7N6_9CAUD|nr:hypothetical protein UFOVP38_42 [uncultured Caudovirales phage]
MSHITAFLRFIGMTTTALLLFCYMWASTPLVAIKTCKPTVIDKVFQ